MRKVLTAVLIAATISLAGCEYPVVIGEKRVAMEVVDVKLRSKSNSKVTLRELESGYVWEDQRLSCSKSRARNVLIGSKWDVVEERYEYPESKRSFSRLAGVSAICDKSN